MSGSPVYIDGRLVGAVSYSLGAFSREPIAGITPIDEMVDATRSTSRRPVGTRARADLSLPAQLGARWPRRCNRPSRARSPFAQSPADVRFAGAGTGAVSGAELGAMLRPIATPLVMGGFRGEVADLVSSGFASSGFSPMTTGGASSSPASPAVASTAPLAPGDAVGVGLVSGDLILGGTGTVTSVDGARVYAFGHPFYNLGPTTFPMTRAWIHTLLPSLMNSSKLGSLGEVIGTFDQDRATAIAGTLGAAPSDAAHHARARHRPRPEPHVPLLRGARPALHAAAHLPLGRQHAQVLRARVRHRRASWSRARALVDKHGEIAFEDLFTGDSPSIGAASYIAGPITFLLKNDFEPVEINKLDLTIVSSESPRTAVLERVWLDAPAARPGRSVPLKLLVRTAEGEDVLHTVRVDIPANATGPLTLMVADGTRLAQIEQRETRDAAAAAGRAQLVKAFNKARKNNRLYVRLVSADAGAVVEGETMAALPASVLAIFDADRSGGAISPLRSATLGEWAIPTDYAVSGARFLSLPLDAN